MQRQVVLKEANRFVLKLISSLSPSQPPERDRNVDLVIYIHHSLLAYSVQTVRKYTGHV